MKIIKLKEAKNDCGGKAYGLYKLIQAGINVPEGFVIEDSQSLSNENISELENKLKEFAKNDKLAVRSSASDEDGNIKSFAGIFETVLNVKNYINDVTEAIKKVNDSANTDKTKNYSNNKFKMNVVVQKMINPRISGICFTNAIDFSGKRCAMFEYVQGIGETLVSGKSNSNRIIVKYNDDKLVYNHARLEGSLINFTGFEELCNLITKAINNYDKNLDIEWCIDENNVANLLQARPVTKAVLIEKRRNSDHTNTIVASRGCVEAETYVIDSDLDYEKVKYEIENFPENKILVCDYTETYYLPAMKKAKGIITNTGSALCHAAIVSRELNIPCIVGYDNATTKFKTGTLIKLDANNNSISIGKENMLVSKEYKLNFGELDCFDNYIEFMLDKTKIFVENTYGGIYVHKPDRLNSSEINEIEKFVRKTFGQVPTFSSDENKYLWIKEVNRFHKLPYFSKYYERVKNSSKSFNELSLTKIQSDLINIAKQYLTYKKTSKDIILNIFIDEIIASINELLDGIIPFGYPMYESYVQSLQLLDNEGKIYNDLFGNTLFKNEKLIKIQKFLHIVSKIKDESYQIIWDMGGNDPDYFEKRDEKVKQILNDNNLNEDFMDTFYDIYLPKYYEKLLEIVEKNEL